MTPVGILRSTDTGVDLEITRAIDAPREDVWATLTESDRTAGWFGPWERLSENSIRVQMRFEEGAPWMEMNVELCESPDRLAVASVGGWQLEVRLTDSTTLTLIHHLPSTEGIGEIGPGWEYYLDNLLASRDGTPLPSFDDYYPVQKDYYTALSPR
ncbi:SRPBCC domain-containing protein [Rhodococcoides kyotonense]|uniref:Activator of Hsp90 ATPase homolog 1-like protein n=1 Tax=Rhodococcoides kyotonense TaxID=398843 RepID=A0A239L6Q5_9NOCA|nr:SRPBCC domain-containing protein [Rhodococcus kyotonensis]SNT25970.1 Activator of Hsp90 ATPase homolog 1-like protein [Rhodococcus kyotonensis]